MPTKVKPVKERNVERYFIKRVKELGGETRKVKWIGRPNAPDRFTMVFGTHFWAELKRPKKTATKAQAREHERMRNSGCRVVVPNTCEIVDAYLYGLERVYASNLSS